MNQIAEELAKQAGMVEYPTGLGIKENTIWGDRNISKLVELVALHCCNRMIELERKYPANLVAREIKKEFDI